MPTAASIADKSTYRQRLVVYVVWHPEFAPGQVLAKRLYDHLMRDSQEPIARGVGIPVYFRSAPADDDSAVPAHIPLDEAQRTAVVVLVDDRMLLGRNRGWAEYVDGLHRSMKGDPACYRLLPVAFSKHAFDLAPDVQHANFIRPPKDVAADEWPALLLEQSTPAGQAAAGEPAVQQKKSRRADPFSLVNPITHELCRLLLNESRLDHGAADYGGRLGQPVQVFVSHAKRDGAEIAECIRNYIQADMQLKTFFDYNDIPFGSEFQKVLESHVDREHTAVLVVQTDEYSTREWCQREVLWAKKYERPVLVLHAVRFGEKCSFPYLGNAPTIRYGADQGPPWEAVLGHLLVEVLRNIHFRQHFEDLRQLFQLPAEVRALPQMPELLTLLELQADLPSQQHLTVVYQEPPLGDHLTEVLRRQSPDVTLTTPVMLATSGLRQPGSPPPLSGKVIGLSIGDSPDLERLGLQSLHVQDAMVEFARYLLHSGAVLAYGGDLRPGGFTSTLRDLVWIYDTSEAAGERLRGYLAWPIHQGELDTNPEYLEWADAKNRIRFDFVPAPADQAAPAPGDYGARNPAHLLTWARCLTAMREKMDSEIHARVALGGKLRGFSGRYPGLAEEALLAKRSGTPLYLIGGFGGCARAVIEAILDQKPASLSARYQLADTDYATMIQQHNRISGVDPVDYDSLTGELASWSIAGLSASNGLTPEENRRLFVTPHVIEMIYLVLRGLLRTLAESREQNDGSAARRAESRHEGGVLGRG